MKKQQRGVSVSLASKPLLDSGLPPEAIYDAMLTMLMAYQITSPVQKDMDEIVADVLSFAKIGR